MSARALLSLLCAFFAPPVLHAQVQQEWVRTFVGPNRSDRPWAIQTDSAGGVFVTGSTSTTNNYDFVTLKYATDGAFQWSAFYNSAVGGSGDSAYALGLDESGNVYVLGSSESSPGPSRLTLVKYGPGGDQIWAVRYTEVEVANPVALLVASNAIYIAGSVYSAESGWDYLIIKYDSDGNTLWTRRYTGAAQSQETVSGMALDQAGNVIVTGTTLSNLPGMIATVKYDANGLPLWTNVSVAAAGSYYGEARGVATDLSGNIYIAGRLSRNGNDLDYAVIKLNSSGQELWRADYGGPDQLYDYLWAMALDSSGNVLVTGFSSSSLTFLDYLTVKFDPDGNRLWTARYSGLGESGQEITSAMKVDSEGNAYVTGYSSGTDGNSEFATVKYDPNGNQVWAARYSADGDFDVPADLALDPQGNVYVTGVSSAPATGENLVTIKYRQFGLIDPPRIISPPQDAEVIAGTSALLEVTATSDAPISYQWRFNGRTLLGETHRTLSIANVQPGREGDYSVTVSNFAGATVSPEARLTVFEPPLIPTEWSNLLITEGGRAYVTASATGDPPLVYQWQLNGTDLPGETNSNLLLFNVDANQVGNYSLVVTNVYGRAEKILAAVTVRSRDTLDRWHWRHPLPGGNDLRSVAYGNGRFVAVGEQGTVLLSSDGLTWTNRTMDWFDLAAITFGNNTFVAVGFFGGLLTSPDGEHWTRHNMPPSINYPGDLYDVAYGNGRFVAVGNGLLLSSTDAVEWQSWSGADAYVFSGVGFGNGMFLAFSSGNGVIGSNDGVNWSMTTAAVGFRSLTHGKGLFVAASEGGGIFTSPDGIVWTLALSGLFVDVAFANDTFVAAGYGIARSTDGLGWDVVLYPPTNFLSGVAHGAGKFVSVGDHGAILTSTDGSAWSEGGGGTGINFRGLARTPRGFVAVGNEGAVWASGDGFAWTNRGAITTNNLRAIAWGSETLVSVGERGSVFTSPDGTTWTPRSAAATDFYGLHYGNGQFIAVGESGAVVVSSNGVNWVAATSPSVSRLQGITFGKGLYVATGRGGTILVSSNALTWQARPSPTSAYLESVVASSNLFVAVGHNGTIVVSLDGMTWAKRDVPAFWDIESVAYAGGAFVAVGDNGNLLTSTDGGDWLGRFTGCRNTLRHVIYADGAVWAVGNNETILKSGQIRPHLLARHSAGNDLNLLIQAEEGRPHRLQASSNLIDWTDVLNFAPTQDITSYREPRTQPRRFFRVISP